MILSTTEKVKNLKGRGRRVVSEVGVYTNYAAAMEFGAAPHTPPLAPLIEWARYKQSKFKRKTNAGKLRGSKINSDAKRPRGKGRPRGRPRLSKGKEREAKRLAYFVQQKIRKKGIRPRFYMAKSMPKIEKNAVKYMKRHMKSLAKVYPVRMRIRRVS